MSEISLRLNIPSIILYLFHYLFLTHILMSICQNSLIRKYTNATHWKLDIFKRSVTLVRYMLRTVICNCAKYYIIAFSFRPISVLECEDFPYATSAFQHNSINTNRKFKTLMAIYGPTFYSMCC